MVNYTRQEILDMIQTAPYGSTVVTFKKVDGTERKLLCTLDEDIITRLNEKNGLATTRAEKASKRTQNLDVVPVFDIENVGWRSFRIDSVVAISHSPSPEGLAPWESEEETD